MEMIMITVLFSMHWPMNPIFLHVRVEQDSVAEVLMKGVRVVYCTHTTLKLLVDQASSIDLQRNATCRKLLTLKQT